MPKTYADALVDTPHPSARNAGLADGLTKREYFAALALQGILAGSSRFASIAYVVEEAVSQADLLIAALNAPEEK